MNIALIVPFLDEEEVLGELLASLAAQERPPDELLLVNDGSSDGSPALGAAFAREYHWARILHRAPRGSEPDRLIGGGALRAFAWAAERSTADVVGKLDADLILPPDFLAELERHLAMDARLGIVGAHLAQRDPEGPPRRLRNPDGHVHGATKLYRRACWEQIAPLPAAMGWDTVDEVRARMRGWRTASVAIPSGDPVHSRRMGSRDGLLRGYRRAGLAAYAYGSTPTMVVLAALARARHRPYGLSGLSFAWGWASAAIRRAPRASSAERRWVRREQRRRLRGGAPIPAPARDPATGAPHLVVLHENLSYSNDIRVRAQVAAVREAGWDVTVIGRTGPGDQARDEEVAGVRIVRFAAAPSGRGIHHYVAEFGLSFLRLVPLVVRVATERPADAVLVCNPPDFLVELARPFARRGAGVVLDDRELSPELFEVKYGRRGLLFRVLVMIERRAFRRSDAILLTNASYVENVTRRAGVSRERVFVVGNGPDARRIYPVPVRPELRRGRRHLVLWMGSMSTQEGLEYLIAAADELVNGRGRDDVSFALVGPGDIHDELRADVSRRGLDGVVDLPGPVGDDLVRAYLSTADVCVNTDQPNPMNDRAAMRKVLEYLAVGRAVVQFPLAEMCRLCGDTTLYARPGDASELADRIAELLDDPGLRERLGASGRQRVHDGLMWSDQMSSLMSALDLARASGRTRAS